MNKQLILVLLTLSILPLSVNAREGGDWSNVDPETREWIKSLKRPDLYDGMTSSCCGEGDAYECDKGVSEFDGNGHVDNYCIITNTRGNPLPVGTKLLIPPNKIQNKQGNPTDHVIVFASESGVVFCCIPNGGI